MIDIILAPHGENKSIRFNMLPNGTKNVLAYLFESDYVSSNGFIVNGIELKINKSLHCLIFGGNGLVMHSGSDAIRYFTHRENPEWAIIFKNDCLGDTTAGKHLLTTMIKLTVEREENHDKM